MTLLESLNLPLGESAKNFTLRGVDERTYTLESFADDKLLVIIFMCNHCPYVQAVWSRLVSLQEKYKNQSVQFVGINSNAANPEYSEDGFEKMQDYFLKYKMNFPYLIDETQNVAREYKAQCTPDIYVFDGDRKLVYHGRLDDNWKDENGVTKRDLDQAINVLLKGEKVDFHQRPSMGCSIKWKG